LDTFSAPLAPLYALKGWRLIVGGTLRPEVRYQDRGSMRFLIKTRQDAFDLVMGWCIRGGPHRPFC